MKVFRYQSSSEAIAILGAVEDLGLDFMHEPDTLELETEGSIFVDLELSYELDYINLARTEAHLRQAKKLIADY